MSVPFWPLPVCPYHFVRYHLVLEPFSSALFFAIFIKSGKRGFPSQKKPPHHLAEPVTVPVNLGRSPTHQQTMTRASLNRRSLDSLTATNDFEEETDDSSWQGTGTARLPDLKHGTPRRIDNGHLSEPHDPTPTAVSSRKYPTGICTLSIDFVSLSIA